MLIKSANVKGHLTAVTYTLQPLKVNVPTTDKTKFSKLSKSDKFVPTYHMFETCTVLLYYSLKCG